jgi:hypothetical protein
VQPHRYQRPPIGTAGKKARRSKCCGPSARGKAPTLRSSRRCAAPPTATSINFAIRRSSRKTGRFTCFTRLPAKAASPSPKSGPSARIPSVFRAFVVPFERQQPSDISPKPRTQPAASQAHANWRRAWPIPGSRLPGTAAPTIQRSRSAYMQAERRVRVLFVARAQVMRGQTDRKL